MLRTPHSASNPAEKEAAKGFLPSFLRHFFLLFYFFLLPVLTVIIVNWAVYFFTQSNFYTESWMAPTLLLLSTFIAGVLIRQKMEDESGGLGLFTLALLALLLFGWFSYQDIHTIGGLYSRFMPRFLTTDVDSFIYALPAVGIFGMIAYKQFTLKYYS
ncbi:hypothetical protein [Vampirovibrio chlorellavorus]|uniref:hypothetical protein n=1 Tax=Vampirovibrio chlorellavorus TaxID=758823 RepID=UPI0026E989AB|nr:hypothetical protein [Vampirovibrio chlorellavorus]